MNVPKGYKQTDVGVIPEDWAVKTLGQLVKLKNGYAFSSRFFSSTGPIVITPGNFKLSGGLKFNKKNTLHYSGDIKNDMKFNNGDLIIVMTDLTPSCDLLGKPGIINSKDVILHNQRIGKISISNKLLNKDYLYRFFTSEIFSKRMKETATGSTVRHTSVGSINNSKIPLPPTKAEQSAIATALSDMDALIEGLEKLLVKKRNIKQGAMQELLKPKKGWVEKTLGKVLKVRHGKSQKGVTDKNGQYPILASGGVIGRANNYLYDKPSVLIGRKGTIDVPQFMDSPFWTVDTLFYTEISEGYDAKFIFYMFNLIDWYSYNEASGVPSLNAKVIESIKKQFPPTIEEQQLVTKILSDMDTEIERLETQLSKYKMLKTGMMQELLTGKKRLI